MKLDHRNHCRTLLSVHFFTWAQRSIDGLSTHTIPPSRHCEILAEVGHWACAELGKELVLVQQITSYMGWNKSLLVVYPSFPHQQNEDIAIAKLVSSMWLRSASWGACCFHRWSPVLFMVLSGEPVLERCNQDWSVSTVNFLGNIYCSVENLLTSKAISKISDFVLRFGYRMKCDVKVCGQIQRQFLLVLNGVVDGASLSGKEGSKLSHSQCIILFL